MDTAPQETRAQIARRRLAELAASVEAAAPDLERPPPGRRRRPSPARRLRPAHVRFAAAAVTLAAVLTVWWLLAARPHEVALPTAAVSVEGQQAAAPSATAELVVDVAGRVRRPGIVTLPPGSRVHEAITAAGGLKRGADASGLNLARVLTDGEQVLVAEPAAAGESGVTAAAKVSLNTADLVALDALPGVGPVTAEAIIAWREENGPFRTVDDLLEVKGIGEATLAELRDRVTV